MRFGRFPVNDGRAYNVRFSEVRSQVVIKRPPDEASPSECERPHDGLVIEYTRQNGVAAVLQRSQTRKAN